MRLALQKLDFSKYAHLQYADLDLCPGILHSREVVKDEIWGGFSMFILEPRVVKTEVLIKNNYEYTYEAMVEKSPLY